MTTQVNLDTVRKTQLIPFLRKGIEFELEKLSNAKNYLVVSYFQGKIIDNWVSNLFDRYFKSTDGEIGSYLNINFINLKISFKTSFKRSHLLMVILLRQDLILRKLGRNLIKPLKEISTTLNRFVTELQMYLSKQQVKQLFDKLIENFLIHYLRLIWYCR
ncbi:MAG: hypothetical protein AAF630_08295 [Cyanobacteria bacterium P01_C01_bin.38]